MNWKQFKKIVLEQNLNLTLIDKNKAKRGLSEVRILRFFFCGNFKPFVDYYNAIGFYVIIEKSYNRMDYNLMIQMIEKDTQEPTEIIFNYTSFKAGDCYNEALKKIEKMMSLKVELMIK